VSEQSTAQSPEFADRDTGNVSKQISTLHAESSSKLFVMGLNASTQLLKNSLIEPRIGQGAHFTSLS
jgi:hypothetical protein